LYVHFNGIDNHVRLSYVIKLRAYYYNDHHYHLSLRKSYRGLHSYCA